MPNPLFKVLPLIVLCWTCALQAAKGSYKRYTDYCSALMSTQTEDFEIPFLFEVQKAGRISYVIGTKIIHPEAACKNTSEFVPDGMLQKVRESGVFLYDPSVYRDACTNIEVEGPSHARRLHLSPSARAAYGSVKSRLQKIQSPNVLFFDGTLVSPSPSELLKVTASLPFEEALAQAPREYKIERLSHKTRQMQFGLALMEEIPEELYEAALEDLIRRSEAAQNGDPEAFADFEIRSGFATLMDEAQRAQLRQEPLESFAETQKLVQKAHSIQAFEDALLHSLPGSKVDLSWLALAPSDSEVMAELQSFLAKQAPYYHRKFVAQRTQSWVELFEEWHQLNQVVLVSDKGPLLAPQGLLERLKKRGFTVRELHEAFFSFR